MSGARFNLGALATYLAGLAGQPVAGIQYGTCYDPNYYRDMGKVYPAVWVRAQRFSAVTDGSASSLLVQKVKIEIAFTIIVERSVDGEAAGGAETRLNAIHDFVTNNVAGYNPTGSFTGFVIASSRDGLASESVMSADVVMSATAIYRSP